jgi:hypothetical protein
MKKTWLFLIIPLLLGLTACGSIQLPGTQSSSASTKNQQRATPDFSKQPIEQKLAIGTLKLEGTDKAVTAGQAKDLLPLWKAVKSLSSSSNASVEEMNGLYQQIQEAMTAEQIQAIKDMTLKPEDFQAMMKQFNVQAPQGMQRPQGTPDPNRSGTGQQQGGDFPGGGMPGGVPPDGGGFPGGGTGAQSNTGQSAVQRTPRAGGGGFQGGMNNLFVQPVITLLQQRSGS